MKLVIAEKRDQAKKLAAPFNMKAEVKGDNYVEVLPCPTFPKGAYFVWAAGHLVSLGDPEDYDKKYEKWLYEDLPIIPTKFSHKVVSQKSGLYSNIKKFVNDQRITEIISAGDPGREGELIVGLVLGLCGNKKPVKRLWTSSLTKNAVTKAFQNLLPGNAKLSLYYEALARQCADWVVGINTSRAYTILLKNKGYYANDNKQTFSTGRVQTPLVSLIVQREEAIERFVSKPYWELYCTFELNEKSYTGKWFLKNEENFTDKIGKKEPAEELAKFCITPPKSSEIKNIEVIEKQLLPPQLFCLSSLQTVANKKYALSPSLVLEAAQSLYLNGHTSYPRADSQYVNEEEAFTFPGILLSFSQMKEYASYFPLANQSLIGDKRYVDSSKVSDHFAIIPTENIPNLNELNENERKIYDLIAKSLIAAHQEPACYEYTNMITHVKFGEKFSTFITKGRRSISEGWRTIFYPAGNFDEDEELESDFQGNLPQLQIGEKGVVSNSNVKEGKTQPPKRFTEGDLIPLMKSAGKTLDDKDLEKILRDTKGLGTEATRANIISNIKDKGYIEVRKNLVYPTEKGRILIQAVGNTVLGSAEMTGKWEKVLADIGEGKAKHQDFIESSKNLTLKLIQAAQLNIQNMPPYSEFTKTIASAKLGNSHNDRPTAPLSSAPPVRPTSPPAESASKMERNFKQPQVTFAPGVNNGLPSVSEDIYHRAVLEVVQSKQASVSLLQRRLSIGYTESARIIDLMEQEGIVSPYDGTMPRQVLIGSEEVNKRFSNQKSGVQPPLGEQVSIQSQTSITSRAQSEHIGRSINEQSPLPATAPIADPSNRSNQTIDRPAASTNSREARNNNQLSNSPANTYNRTSTPSTQGDDLGYCPKCKVALIVDKGKFYGCSAYQQTRCGWSFNKHLRGVEIKREDIKNLLNKGQTGLIRGFQPKDLEKPVYDAVLFLTKDGGIEFRFPDQNALKLPTYLLKVPLSVPQNIEFETRKLARKIEEKCTEIKLPATISGIVNGPKITTISILPAKSTKNISNYKKFISDFQATLLAKKIMMYAPIPGQPYVGIEIPNPNPYIVNLRQMLEDKEFLATKTALTIPIGMSNSGRPVFYNLAKAPHVLIGGTTGSGKSVFLNSIIVSLIYSCTPDELRIIMIDPKRVELTVYSGIPHLYGPIVNEPNRAILALKTLEAEMEKRYRLFQELKVRDILGYNDKIQSTPGTKKMPYIVLIIDELADLMMTVSNDLVYHLQRMSQMARAAGIHIIVATQRPTREFIPGSIKALLPTRIAFAVASVVDSKTILDEKGAEELMGQGDMLFSRSDEPLTRLVSPFVTDEEVEQVVQHLIKLYSKQSV